MDFEKLLLKLNDITNKLEDKNTTLEQSFELFDEGLKISAQCADILEKYSNRLENLKTQWANLQNRIENNE